MSWTSYRAKIQKYFRWFLVQMKSLEFAFEINWPLKSEWKHTISFFPDDQNCFDNPNAMVSVHIGSTSIYFINRYLQISLYEYWCSLETDLCRKMGQSNVTSLVFHWINDSTGNYDQGNIRLAHKLGAVCFIIL